MVIRRKQKKTRRDGLYPYRLACPPHTQYVVGSRPGWAIPKTIIKLVKTLGKEFDSVTRLSKSRIVYGTVYGVMPFKDLLRSIARVEYRIPVSDFYLVLHCRYCRNKHFNELINQSSWI